MKKLFSYLPILLLGFGILFSGCIDDKFDEPPVDGVDPDITTNATISDILALWQPGNIVEITDDLIFSAIVISSDEAGNFYKTLVVEDEDSGIRFSINSTGLYNDFPQFRRVFVKAKGLYIGDYNELPTIGAGVGTNSQGNPIIERIPNAILSEHIIKGMKNRPSPVREKTMAEVTLADVNRLIRLKDVEFVSEDLNLTMAEPSADANRTLTDCIGNKIPMRNSQYSSFADASVPQKHGTVEAVVGVYGSTIQLGLSAFEDIKMTEERCTAGNLTTTVGDWTYYGTSVVVDSVDENFNALNSGDDVQITGWLNATDVANGRFWQANEYQSDNYIQATAYNDNAPNTHNWVITPGVTNFSEKILSFRSAWGFGGLEHVLKVYVSTDFDGIDIGAATWTEINPNVAVSATGEHQWLSSGDYPLTAFSGVGYVAFEYTGSANNNPSALRLDDVKINTTGSGGGTIGGDEILKEEFEGLVQYDVLDLAGWTNIAEVGADEDRWFSSNYNGNGFAEAQGYNTSGPETVWLITPSFDATTAIKMNFETAFHHWKHSGLSVWISNDFNGTDLGTANWQEVSCTLAEDGTHGQYDWVPSGDIHFQDYFSTDNVRVAFKFSGNNTTETTGFRLDNVIVVEE